MKLNEVFAQDLKYPVSITWKVGDVWMNLASGYWQDDKFYKNPHVPFRLHDGLGDSEKELAYLSDEIRKHTLPTDWRKPIVIYPKFDGIQYSVIVSPPTEGGYEHGKAVEI